MELQGNTQYVFRLIVFNVMRKIAMALFKRDTLKSTSMARKKKMAGLDYYRSSLLESGVAVSIV
jgi:hypothetical protein